MSRKDYVGIAKAIHATLEGCQSLSETTVCFDLANKLATLMESDNERFDRQKFLSACGFAH